MNSKGALRELMLALTSAVFGIRANGQVHCQFKKKVAGLIGRML